MSDEMRLIQNNMQVIEELHHKIMALENWKKEQYTKDFNYLNKEVCDRFNEINELKTDVNNQGECIIEHERRFLMLESVLKDHLESHENVARGQLNPDISQTALFQLFDRDIKKQLQKLSGEKEVVQKGIGDDSSVDEPEPIRLSSNGMSIGWKNEGMPSTHSKPDSDCINIRENVKFLTNDTYIVISREDFDFIYYGHPTGMTEKEYYRRKREIKKEVEKQ